jgi:hypothetical protein
MASFGIPLKQSIGASLGVSIFFLSGLPGGIDYVMLCLVYHGKMQKATEKRIFASINVWLRAPGTIWFMCLAFMSWREGKVFYVPSWLGWTIALLHLYNGEYYSMIAVESYARFEYNAAAGQIDSTGQEIKAVNSEKLKQTNKSKHDAAPHGSADAVLAPPPTVKSRSKNNNHHNNNNNNNNNSQKRKSKNELKQN